MKNRKPELTAGCTLFVHDTVSTFLATDRLSRPNLVLCPTIYPENMSWVGAHTKCTLALTCAKVFHLSSKLALSPHAIPVLCVHHVYWLRLLVAEEKSLVVIGSEARELVIFGLMTAETNFGLQHGAIERHIWLCSHAIVA